MMRTPDRTRGVGKATFSMVFHCHQPVFNLEQIIESAYHRAYLPLFRVLSGSRGIKATVHLSGGLLEWIEKRHPDLLGLLRVLVDRGQVELLGGGCYEPVMTLLPETDKARQIEANTKIIRRLFGVDPRGIWISERVWHHSLVDTISEQGIEYAILDDHHILNSGVGEQEISRPFRITGRKGSLTLLPALRKLRYLMPFRPPKVVAGYLRERAEKATEGHKCFVFADDGEKFGAWPRTCSRMRKRGWLDSFFELLNSGSIQMETVLCSDILDTVEPRELAGIPPSGYPELMEWSEGGFLNFLDKYPEAGRMRERMLKVSERIRGYERTGKADSEAVRELMKAQTGCAYWHGIFGGVYLPHMRDGVYRHLIEAENILDRTVPGSGKGVDIVETDEEDGDRRIRLRNRHVDVFLRASGGGVIYEMDDRKRCSNLLNTMSRVREDYHNKLERGHRGKITEARKAALRGEYPDIHDILGIAERGLSEKLHYDDVKRDSFITHIGGTHTPRSRSVPGDGTYEFRNGDYCLETEGEGNFITAVFSKRAVCFPEKNREADLEVIKKVTVGSGPSVIFSHDVIDRSEDHRHLRVAVEFNILVNDKRFMVRPRSLKSDRIVLKDMYSGAVTEFFTDRRADIEVHPVFTVNETESGLKKTFQGMSIFFGVSSEQKYDERERSSLQISLVLG